MLHLQSLVTMLSEVAGTALLKQISAACIRASYSCSKEGLVCGFGFF